MGDDDIAQVCVLVGSTGGGDEGVNEKGEDTTKETSTH